MLKVASRFQKHSISVLRADTQFTVVESTLKGFNKWVESHGTAAQQDVSRPVPDILRLFITNS
jgi:exportin-5